MTDTDVLIVGAGLSGLALARHLTAAGVAHEVLEGRARIGGRILSAVGGMDLGPAWIWPGQPRIAALLADLGLATFAQHSRGMLVYEDRGGAIRRDLTFSTMEGALRVTGGLSRVTDGLASGLAPVRLGAEVRALALTDASVTATLADGGAVTARRVALCVPPRVAAARIAFTPAADLGALRAVPTWMAGHAKAIAIYDAPFWRASGLSGDVISHRGPMAELHDASPADDGFGALFGFVGVPASVRLADPAALRDACAAHFARLF
jgi:monoamine oxidase